MELKVYKDMVNASETICDTKTEIPIETEILIPDYMPEVFKIVKCFIKLVTLQKHLSQNRFTCDGYIRCLVYYQTDAGNSLCQTEQKIPFSRQMEVKEGEYSGWESFVTGETEYLNCRAVSGRRLDIRGAYIMTAIVKAQVKQEILTAVSENGIEQKAQTLQTLKAISSQEKMITVLDTISFEAQPVMILDTMLFCNIQETKLIQGKAIVKGEINAEIVYRSEEGWDIKKITKLIPFNEIIDVDGTNENCKSLTFADALGCTIMAKEDASGSDLQVSAILSVKVYAQCEFIAVTDAFSTICETQLDSKNIIIEEEIDSFSLQTNTVASGSLPAENLKIIDVKATPLPFELIEQNGVTVVRGRVTAHIICANELNEIDCYDKTAEFILLKGYQDKLDKLRLICKADILAVTARKAGAETEVKITLNVTGLVTKQTNEKVLENIVCLSEYENVESNIALHIYYAQENENLFDIAKRYHASPAIIKSANNLEQNELRSHTQLLIPCAR